MKKLKIILFIFLVLSLIFMTKVFAATPELTLEGDSTAKPGETKKIALKITAEEEIGMVSGTIEKAGNITSITVTGKNGWNLTYNSNTGVFNIYKAEGAKSEEIMDIEYTAAASEGTGTIQVSNTQLTTINYETTDIGTISKQITIKEEVIPEPEPITLTGISVTKAPTKTVYKAGENFDSTGMVVTANYSDGSTKTVTGYTVTDGSNLTEGKTRVTISYTENGVTKTATVNITVTKAGTTADDSTGNGSSNNQNSNGGASANGNQSGQSNNQDASKGVETKLPNTGVSNYIIIAFAITVVIAIVAFVKNREYKNI